MSVPARITAVARSFTARWPVSPKSTMAKSVEMTALDLSMGTTRSTSPDASALK